MCVWRCVWSARWRCRATRQLLRDTLGVAQCAVPVLDFDRDAAQWAERSVANPDPQVIDLTPEHLAYVIYTLSNLLLWCQQICADGQQASMLQKIPFGFDASAWELLWPLAMGARLSGTDGARAAGFGAGVRAGDAAAVSGGR